MTNKDKLILENLYSNIFNKSLHENQEGGGMFGSYHPFKDKFIKAVLSGDQSEQLRQSLSNYILDAEDQEGEEYWDGFSNVEEAIQDFQTYRAHSDSDSEMD